MTSFDGDPGTSLSTFDPVPELPPMPSNVAFAIPPERTDPSDFLSEPIDESTLSAPLQTRRPFRWPALGVVVGVIAAVALAVVWLPKAADSEAASTRTAYHDASLTVREFLPTAQASLDIVTKPSSTEAALGTVIPVVSELTSDATTLAIVAAEPLPTALPFVPSDAMDGLPPLQDRSAILASDTNEIARQIGHAYVFRTSITELLVVGDLPTSAGTEEINALSVTLAASLAENASLIADLPSNSAFDDVASAAADAVGAYARWQEDYLAALADGDAAAAQELITGITAVRDDLISDTARTLSEFRDVLDERIVSLSKEFDDHLANLSQSRLP
jgi:cell division septation protein DedD